MLSLELGLLFGSISLVQLDPIDDFSLSLRSVPHLGGYALLSEHRVAEILADRLDLFPQSQVGQLARHLLFLCHHHRFDPAFILSLIDVESSFRIKVVSPVGAIGLMQVMPMTADFVIQELGFQFSGYEPFRGLRLRAKKMTLRVLSDPFVNLAVGIAYLAWLRDYYHEATYHLLAAYNIGPTRMDQLLARDSFTPVLTKKYYLSIRNQIHRFRFYHHYNNKKKGLGV
jgi:soluble lytic murein transglycosylase-like protein